jgi:hypothetical protein
VSGQHNFAAALYPPYPLHRKFGGLQSDLDAEARRNDFCLFRGRTSDAQLVVLIEAPLLLVMNCISCLVLVLL